MEPLEGSQEEDRLAAFSRLLLRAFRSRRDALPVLKCTGVVNIVSFEGEPAPIPEHEIDSIRLLVEQRARVRSLSADLKEGMMVEVVHGPLSGVVGRLVRKDAASARLVLSVDLIGQAVSASKSMRRMSALLISPHADTDENWLRQPAVAVCRRAHGGHDRHGVPPPGQAAGRLRSGRHRDGQLRRPGARHRSHARVRRVHRRRAAGLDSDLRRRSRRRWPTRRRSSRAWAPTSST